MAEVAELNGEAEPVGVAALRHDQRDVVRAERVVPHDGIAIAQWIAERGALLGREKSAAWHGTSRLQNVQMFGGRA
jgi:hypothetical protein